MLRVSNHEVKAMQVFIFFLFFIVMLLLETILQYFYKLLMWQIFISSNKGPPLISHLYLPIVI